MQNYEHLRNSWVSTYSMKHFYMISTFYCEHSFRPCMAMAAKLYKILFVVNRNPISQLVEQLPIFRVIDDWFKSLLGLGGITVSATEVMELLRDWQPEADSKHTAQECHHVEACGYDQTVSGQHWEQIVLPWAVAE